MPESENKAKRLIKEYKFDKDHHHIALVHTSQGGAANGYTEALVLKSTNDITDEYLEKATMVKVTLPFDDFLEKFFGMWEDNADMLTEILGFKDEEDVSMQDKNNMSWEDYKAECEKERQDFINSVEILKSMKGGDVKFSDLDAKSYLSVLRTQERYEQKQKEAVKAFAESASKQGENAMKIEEALAEVQKAKDQLAEVQKAHDAVKQELEILKAAQATAKEAARKEALAAVVPADKVDEIFKGMSVMDDAGFKAVVDVMKAAADKEADLFKEKGVDGGGDSTPEDKVAAILKATYPQK